MDVIDRHWLQTRLSGRHGEQRKLADAVGLSPDKITKILKGERAIRAHEIPRFLQYFQGASPAGFSDPGAGFASETLRPARVPALERLAHLLAPAARSPTFYILSRAVAWAGLLAGDYLVVETGGIPRDGQLVVVTLNDTDHDIQSTELRRFLPPLLIDMAPDAAQPSLPALDSQAHAIVATVCGVVRAPDLAPS